MMEQLREDVRDLKGEIKELSSSIHALNVTIAKIETNQDFFRKKVVSIVEETDKANEKVSRLENKITWASGAVAAFTFVITLASKKIYTVIFGA